jgi:cytochrome c oxidase subunit 3
MFLTIIGGLIFVGSQAWEWKTSSKGNTVLLKQRRKFTQFVDKEGNRVALAEFATTLPEEREQLTRKKRKWFMDEPSLLVFSWSSSGFKHPELLIRTEVITKTKENNFSRRVCSKIESSTLCC